MTASVVTATRASQSHRDNTTADTVVRSYAEAVKSAVRQTCVGSAVLYTVTYTQPSGYTINTPVPLTPQTCPTATAALPVTISISGPTGARSMDIRVRRA